MPWNVYLKYGDKSLPSENSKVAVKQSTLKIINKKNLISIPIDEGSWTDVIGFPGNVLNCTTGSSSFILKHWRTPFLSPIANCK